MRIADVKVYNSGKIFWLQHRVLQSACLVDLRDYPYDQQTCHLWFQSLSYSSSSLDLQPYLPGFDYETYLSEFQVRSLVDILGRMRQQVVGQ